MLDAADEIVEIAAGRRGLEEKTAVAMERPKQRLSALR